MLVAQSIYVFIIRDSLTSGWGGVGLLNAMASKVTLQLVLRDINHDMVKAWNDPQAFGGDDYKDCVQVCYKTTATPQFLERFIVHTFLIDKLWGHISWSSQRRCYRKYARQL